MVVVSTREKWFSGKHLGENTAYRPDIDGLINLRHTLGLCHTLKENAAHYLGILLERQHDLWCAVPASCDVFSHETSLCARGLGCLDGSCEAEIADLEVAVGVEQEIRWFQITMYNIGGVKSLKRPESLVDEVLSVIVGEILSANDTMHVCFHQFLNHCGQTDGSGDWREIE